MHQYARDLKILHLPFGYFPDIHGGTEVYVAALCRALNVLGHESLVAAPGTALARYRHDGIDVHRYPVDDEVTDRDRNGEGDPVAAAHVSRIIDEVQPDIIHLHALTSGVSLRVLRAARLQGSKTVITYHTPTVSCARGTLLYMGDAVCDGAMAQPHCTACSLHALGLGKGQAFIMSSMPSWLGKVATYTALPGRAITALRRKEMIGLRHQAVRAIFREVDHVIALGDWTEQLLKRNGLGQGKTSVIPHALPHKINGDLPQQVTIPDRFSATQPLKLLYLGRIAPEKGVDVIVRALAGLPTQMPIGLDIYGLQQDEGAYVREVVTMVERDQRICLHAPVAPHLVIELLRQYHLLLISSQCLETGPFVLLESLSARTPVVGSRLGGIEERITHEGDGMLITDYHRPESWREALQDLVYKPSRIAAMREHIQPPPGFDEVAEAHQRIYRQLVEGEPY